MTAFFFQMDDTPGDLSLAPPLWRQFDCFWQPSTFYKVRKINNRPFFKASKPSNFSNWALRNSGIQKQTLTTATVILPIACHLFLDGEGGGHLFEEGFNFFKWMTHRKMRPPPPPPPRWRRCSAQRRNFQERLTEDYEVKTKLIKLLIFPRWLMK